MKKSKSLIHLYFKILLCFLFVNVGFSQSNENSDLEGWSSITLKYKHNKKLSFELEEQLRLDENISETKKYFTQLSTSYSVFKNFDIGVGARFIRENDNEGKIQGYENHFRFHIDASYKQKIDQFTLKYRLRYQNKNEMGISSEEGDVANQNLRFKTSLGYNIKKWKLDPKFAAEIFNHFEKDEESEFNKYRLTLSTDYEFKKLGTLGLFYRIEKELNQTFNEKTNIIGLKYTYTIKNK